MIGPRSLSATNVKGLDLTPSSNSTRRFVHLRHLIISHASLIAHGNKLDGSSKACIARRDFSLGKTGRSSRLSMYCPANCRALSSNNGSSSRSATRLTALCSFAITSLKIVCCNFCKGLFLKAGWRWVDRNYGKEKAS